jgi:hypothetical protein
MHPYTVVSAPTSGGRVSGPGAVVGGVVGGAVVCGGWFCCAAAFASAAK